MHTTLLIAGLIAIATGVAHSVLGELLIFRDLCRGRVIQASGPVPRRQLGILWATWHLATVLGWAFGGLMLYLAWTPSDTSLTSVVLAAAAFANLSGALLVLVGTRGRHPGWVALLAIAALCGTSFN